MGGEHPWQKLAEARRDREKQICLYAHVLDWSYFARCQLVLSYSVCAQDFHLARARSEEFGIISTLQPEIQLAYVNDTEK
jgi:hypothetical protein